MATTSDNVITTNSLNKETPLTTVTAPAPDVAGLLGTTQGAIDYTNKITTDFNTANQNKTNTQTSITDTMNKLLGKTEDIQKANEESGLNAATKQINQLNAQASQLNREALAIPIQTQERNANTGATDAGVAPQNASALRQNALKALSIAQQTDIATANYTAAKDKAQQIIDLKYKPMEDELKIKLQQYEFNKDNLEAIDKKRTEALGIALKKQEQDLADKKQNEKDIKDIALEAAKNGADAKTIDAINNSTNFKEAIVNSGSFLATPSTDIVKLDNGNTIMVDKRTGKVIKSFGGAKSTAVPSFAVTNNSLKTTYNNDAVKQISDIIKYSKAKPNQAMTDAINVIAGIQQMVKDNPDFKFPGINPLVRIPGIIADERSITNRSNINAINLKVQQWASGAALTEQQTAQVKKMTPDKNDTDRQVKEKLNALANYMTSQVSGQLAGQGISFVSDKIDYFAPSSDEKLTQLYKQPEMKTKIEQAIQIYPDATADEILQIVE